MALLQREKAGKPAGEREGVSGVVGSRACKSPKFREAPWEIGLARNTGSGKIPLRASYRARIIPFPSGKEHPSPCAPAELGT